MASAGSGEREGRTSSSRRPSPLRATVPVQAMHRTSPLRLRNRISPDTEITPGLDLSTATSTTKGRVGQGRGSQGGEGSALMRRTASLDTIYLKGQWPKDVQQQPFSSLLLDKASQTPEEWAATCYGSLSLGWSSVCEESVSSSTSSSNNSSNNNSRRPSVSVVSSPLFASGQQVTTASGEQIDKFIRHRNNQEYLKKTLFSPLRLQRNNKEGTSGGGLRYSPVHADHSVLAPTPIHPRHHALQHANGGSRAIPIPQMPKPLLPPRLRNSVEGLNQEIERLVLRPSHIPADDVEDVWGDVGRDGRRAPIADYLRFTRSVDTQTPARGSAVSATSSNHTSPSISPPTSPPLSQLAAMPPSTPSPTSTPALATSPHINKFLAREPPDGCEKISLKLHEDRSGASKGEEWPAVRPPAAFTLRPSQGSAFCAPDRTSTEEPCGATALRLCPHDSGSQSEPCPACVISSSSGTSEHDFQHISRPCQPSSSQTLTCEAGVSTKVLSPAHATIGTSPELTADQ